MKKIVNIILIIFIIISLSGCGSESVYNTKEKPFIISNIKRLEDGKIVYMKGRWEQLGSEFFATKRQSITVDEDLGYSVGDTINFFKKHDNNTE
jgi:hypothetical protein